jgi:hypothetical protein
MRVADELDRLEHKATDVNAHDRYRRSRPSFANWGRARRTGCNLCYVPSRCVWMAAGVPGLSAGPSLSSRCSTRRFRAQVIHEESGPSGVLFQAELLYFLLICRPFVFNMLRASLYAIIQQSVFQ